MKRFNATIVFVASFASVAGSGPAWSGVDPATRQTWSKKCASCHGEDGRGQTPAGKKMAVQDLTTAAWNGSVTDAGIKQVIENGLRREKNGVNQEMDAYKGKLDAERIDALVTFTRMLEKYGTPASSAAPAAGSNSGILAVPLRRPASDPVGRIR